MMLKGAALLTCFNRKSLTLRCLQQLAGQQRGNNYQLDIYLVDDGSTDGTSEAVRQSFPNVHLISGDGNLYWCGGMRLAWQQALKKEYDFYLWVNDDVDLYSDAIERLVQCFLQLSGKNSDVGAITGTMAEPETKQCTYGGRVLASHINPLKLGEVLPPLLQPRECTVINGNLTLIPHSCIDKVGILSSLYTHALGDFDYSLRLYNKHIKSWVAPGIYGECERNGLEGTWKDKSLPFKLRLNLLNRPNQITPEAEMLCFIRLHGGKFWPLLWLKIWLQWRLPILWLLK